MPSPVSALNKIKNMYSPLERAVIAHKLESMPSSQWAAYIKANAPRGAKKEALAVRLDELLAKQPKITKAEIVKHIQEKSPKISTKNIRADGFGSDETQYAKYVLPGGQDYTETLITLPPNTSSPSIRTLKSFELSDENGKLLGSGTVPMSPRMQEMVNNNPNWVVREFNQPHPADVRRDPSNFSSGHFDEPNILAHLRTNIKLTPDNKDVLFLEELQSDWAQQGRKKGFRPHTIEEYYNQKASNVGATPWEELDDNSKDMIRNMYNNESALPRGPYVEDTGDWTGLALKKAIERAVDEGQSHLAWTTGAQQADRYDLAKQLNTIHFDPNTGHLSARDHNGTLVMAKTDVSQDNLADYIGKEGAQKILGTAPNQNGVLSLVGDDIKVGGEGMRGYYDQIVPSTANDILKSMGVTERVKPIGIQLGGNNVSEQMGFEITPEIRDYVMNQGFSAFAEGGAVHMAHGGDVDYDELYEFKDYGNRETGEAKDTGALGEIRMPNGRDVMTEYSINVDGREMPSIVEGMHPADLNYIRETGTVPKDAEATAVRSANKRESRGLSPFWNKKETFAQGGKVDYDAMYEFR